MKQNVNISAPPWGVKPLITIRRKILWFRFSDHQDPLIPAVAEQGKGRINAIIDPDKKHPSIRRGALRMMLAYSASAAAVTSTTSALSMKERTLTAAFLADSALA